MSKDGSVNLDIPSPPHAYVSVPEPPPSRRERISTAAMRGLLSNPNEMSRLRLTAERAGMDVGAAVAAVVVEYANALIAELDGTNE